MSVPEKKPKRPRPIGVTFNPHNSQLIVLCEDGQLWARVLDDLAPKTGQFVAVWKWEKLDEFKPE